MTDSQIPFYPVRRLCERPGCAGVAEVSYGMDNVTLTVWIDGNAVPERELAGRLCRRHANALTVPRGWSIDDRRQPVPQLFAVKEEPKAPRVKRVKKEPVIKMIPVAPPSLFEKLAEDLGVVAVPVSIPVVEVIVETVPVVDAVVDVDVPAPVVIDPDETQAIPWSPRFAKPAAGVDDDADVSKNEVKPVMGRLLGRAFGVFDPDE